MCGFQPPRPGSICPSRPTTTGTLAVRQARSLSRMWQRLSFRRKQAAQAGGLRVHVSSPGQEHPGGRLSHSPRMRRYQMTVLPRRVSLNVAARERARDVQDDVTGCVSDLERSGIAAAGLTVVGQCPLHGRTANAVELPGPGALVGVEPRGGLVFREGRILAARRACQRFEVETVTVAPVDLEVIGRYRAIAVELRAERYGRIPPGDELAAAGQESLAARRQATEAA